MRILILIAMACFGLQASHTLPTKREFSHEDVGYNTTHISDPNSPIRLAVKQRMNIFIIAINDIVSNTLNQIPNTEGYGESRQKLTQLVETVEKYTGQLENCVWNLVDLTYDLNMFYKYFERPNAFPEDKETLRLLEEYGLKDLHRVQLSKAWWSFIREEFGPAEELNEDYC